MCGIQALMAGVGASVVVSITPNTQSASGSNSVWTFSVSVDVVGGVATAYSWTVTPVNGPSWNVQSGGTTASAVISTGPVASGDSLEATATCTVTVGGVNYQASVELFYDRL